MVSVDGNGTAWECLRSWQRVVGWRHSLAARGPPAFETTRERSRQVTRSSHKRWDCRQMLPRLIRREVEKEVKSMTVV